jgi:hypothetical protein
LVIPILVYTTVIQLIIDIMIVRFLRGSSALLWTIIKGNALIYQTGHLWFLQVLLLFAVIYVVFRALTERAPKESLQLYRDRFPPDAVLFLSVAVAGVLTFAMRLVFPVGDWFLHIQPHTSSTTLSVSTWAWSRIGAIGSGAWGKLKPAAGGSSLW